MCVASLSHVYDEGDELDEVDELVDAAELGRL